MFRRSPFCLAVVGTVVVAGAVWAQGPEPPATFLDQFRRPQSVADCRGEVVVLVSGGQAAADDCRRLGESLHIAFHPSAAGLTGAAAANAPARPSAADGTAGPNVRVVPVARTGYVPTPLRGLICNRFRASVPDVPIWIDFDDQMVRRYGVAPGIASADAGPDGGPQITVFDAAGRRRFGGPGPVDAASRDELLGRIEALRHEAVGRD